MPLFSRLKPMGWVTSYLRWTDMDTEEIELQNFEGHIILSPDFQ